MCTNAYWNVFTPCWQQYQRQSIWFPNCGNRARFCLPHLGLHKWVLTFHILNFKLWCGWYLQGVSFCVEWQLVTSYHMNWQSKKLNLQLQEAKLCCMDNNVHTLMNIQYMRMPINTNTTIQLVACTQLNIGTNILASIASHPCFCNPNTPCLSWNFCPISGHIQSQALDHTWLISSCILLYLAIVFTEIGLIMLDMFVRGEPLVQEELFCQFTVSKLSLRWDYTQQTLSCALSSDWADQYCFYSMG